MQNNKLGVLMKRILFILFFIILSSFIFSDTIDVLIKGVDDGVKTNKQQDYKEAVMNAKLQAIERAGVEIQSITKVVNFKLKYDMVESKAKAVLLPGFQIMDMGYQQDSTYQVVLSAKVRVGDKDEDITSEGLMRKVEILTIKAKKTENRGEQLNHYRKCLELYETISEKYSDSPEALEIEKKSLINKLKTELNRPARIGIFSEYKYAKRWEILIDRKKVFSESSGGYTKVDVGIHYIQAKYLEVVDEDKGGTAPKYMPYEQSVRIKYSGEVIKLEIPCKSSNLFSIDYPYDKDQFSETRDIYLFRKNGMKQKVGYCTVSGKTKLHFVLFEGKIKTSDCYYDVYIKVGNLTRRYKGRYERSDEICETIGPLQIHIDPFHVRFYQADWLP